MLYILNSIYHHYYDSIYYKDINNWEIKQLLRYIPKRRNIHILAFGVCNNNSLEALYKSKYVYLYGQDTKSQVYNLPYYTQIKYMEGTIHNTHFPQNFFDTLISLPLERLNNEYITKFLIEASRILKSKGKLFLSIHYYKTNIAQTSSQIINKEEVNYLINVSKLYGFKLLKSNIQYMQFKKHIIIFLAFSLKKNKPKKSIKQLNLVCPTLGKHDGISEHTKYLEVFLKKHRINVKRYRFIGEIKNNWPILYEYEASNNLDIPENYANRVFVESHSLPYYFNLIERLKEIDNIKTIKPKLKYLIYILSYVAKYIYHNIFDRDMLKKAIHDRNILRSMKLFSRTNYLATSAGFQKYTLLPVIAYPKSKYSNKNAVRLHIGSFGFALKFKRFDKICELAKKLNINLTLLLSIPNNTEAAKIKAIELANDLKKKYQDNRINIEIGWFNYTYIAKRLSNCSHIIFAQDDMLQTSGTMRFAIALGKPVIAIDSYQAREAQVYRVNKINDITINYLETHQNAIKLDDGLYYLITYLKNPD